MATIRGPRLVLVTRPTPIEQLLQRHGTYGQARFYLESRGQSIAWAEEIHERCTAGLATVQRALPQDARRARLDRGDLASFLLAPDDVVIVVGQDGLVPNVAKYLDGQLMLGINPDPARYDGILCPHPPRAMPALLEWLETRNNAFSIQRRTMAVAEREDGQQLLALNEIFVGHRTHQSARYRLRVQGREERQSSSGVIVSTGTGSTGWARSIARQRRLELDITPEDERLLWLVREPFPSRATAVDLDMGFLATDDALEMTSEMAEDGVLFGDGIEADAIEFLSGQSVRVSLARQRLNLVVPRS